MALSLCLCSGASIWRHFPAPAGVAAPQSRNQLGGEDCLSEASSAALTVGTGAKAPPWGHARAPMVLGPFAETKGPRRAGPKPRKNLSPPPSVIPDLIGDPASLPLVVVPAPSLVKARDMPHGAVFSMVIPGEARNLAVFVAPASSETPGRPQSEALIQGLLPRRFLPHAFHAEHQPRNPGPSPAQPVLCSPALPQRHRTIRREDSCPGDIRQPIAHLGIHPRLRGLTHAGGGLPERLAGRLCPDLLHPAGRRAIRRRQVHSQSLTRHAGIHAHQPARAPFRVAPVRVAKERSRRRCRLVHVCL